MQLRIQAMVCLYEAVQEYYLNLFLIMADSLTLIDSFESIDSQQIWPQLIAE